MTIPEDVRTLLSLGPTFNMLPAKDKIHLPGLLADIDNIATLTPLVTRNVLTARAVDAITNYMTS